MPFISDPDLQKLDVVDEIETRATELESQMHDVPAPEQWIAPDNSSTEHSTLETVSAALEEENIVSAATRHFIEKSKFAPFEDDIDFNVFDEDLSEYKEFLDEFDNVTSANEMNFVKRKIDIGLQNRQTISESGGMGIASLVAAGLIDPTSFIPIAGVAYKATKAGTVVAGGLSAAAQIGAIETGREAVLHSMQPTRTIEESVLNIGGATVLSGILGAAATGLSTTRFSSIATEIDDYMEAVVHAEQPLVARHAGAAENLSYAPPAHEPSLDNEALVGGKVAEVAAVGPSGNLAGSPSLAARVHGQRLAEDPYLRVKHQQGIASEVSWESLIKARDRDLDDGIRLIKQGWKSYAKSVPREERVFKSYGEFDEAVSHAMRRGDAHDIAEVSTVAKGLRRKFDKIKDDAIAAKLLPENTSALGALSYLPRAYNRELIIANKNDFRAELLPFIRATLKGSDMEDYVDEAVDDIVNNILGARDKGNVASVVGSTSPLKGRKLDIPDEVLEKWMDSSAHNLLSGYHRTMIPRIAFKNRFGDETIDSMKQEIRKEYDELSRDVKTGKEQKALDNKMQKDLDNLQGIYNRGLGVQDTGLHRSGGVSRTLAAAKEINRQRLLGGVWLTSLADTARPIIVNGLGRYAGMVYKLAKNPEMAKLVMSEKRRLSAALEVTEQVRLSKMADVSDDLVGGSKFERGLKWTGEKFSAASLLPHHNSVMKSLVGLLTEDKIIRFSAKLNSGKKISVKEIQRLARLGIDGDMAKRIAKQYDQFGETSNGLTLGNFDDWDDLGARQAIDTAIVKMADETINTPGLGTLPLFFDKGIAQTLFQFKSFLVASHNQTLLAGLQQGDVAFVTSMATMVGMGAMITELKDTLAGRDKSRTATEMLIEGTDRSGILSIPMEVNNIADKMSGHRISVNAMIGGNEAKRFASRNKLESILGPTAGLTTDLMTTAEMLGGKDLKQSDIHRYRKLMPFQNLFYTRWAFDELEEGLAEQLGARK